MKRILIYCINFLPDQIGIGKYTGEMAVWLAKRGYELRVVTAPPYYPEWRVMEEYSGKGYRIEQWQGIKVWRCPIWVPDHPTGAKRILHLLSFALSSAPVVLRQVFWRPDIVWVVAPSLFCAPAAWLASRLSGARSWLHVQDFEVNAAFAVGLLRQPVLKSLALWMERRLLRLFHRVSTISRMMIVRLCEKGVAEERCVMFPNWVDLEAIRPLHERNPFRGELGISDEVAVALYAGNMGEKQGLESLLDSARQLRGEASIRFVLCGEGAARKRLILKYGDLPNVIWLPLQPLGRLNELLNLADIHLLPQLADVADFVMPSKLTGMLASGRPIIATAVAGTQVDQVVSRCGIMVPPGDPNALAMAILRLARDHGARLRMGEAARNYALENSDSSRILREFEYALLSCCERRA